MNEGRREAPFLFVGPDVRTVGQKGGRPGMAAWGGHSRHSRTGRTPRTQEMRRTWAFRGVFEQVMCGEAAARGSRQASIGHERRL